jgi:hypothetical protein
MEINRSFKGETMAKHEVDYGYKAFRLLKFVFVFTPIVAGLDKFFNLLTHWSLYLSPAVLRMISFHDRPFMRLVGVVEIIVGIGIYKKPKIFSKIVALWLALIILNLLIQWTYLDIALHDFALMFSALALAQLSKKYAK